MWGNEPEPCVFLSLWFSSQSPSAPPQLQENITRSARQQQARLFPIVLTNKNVCLQFDFEWVPLCGFVGGVWLTGLVFLHSEASVDLGPPSVFWLFLFLLVSFDLLPRPELLCSCSSIWFTHKKVKSDYEGLCPKWRQKKKHFLISLNMISKGLKRSTIVNPTLTATVLLNAGYTLHVFESRRTVTRRIGDGGHTLHMETTFHNQTYRK